MAGAEYIEIQIETSVDPGELMGWLDDPNCLGAWENGPCVCLYWAGRSWNAEARLRVGTALGRLGDPDAADRIQVLAVPDQDWNASWAASLAPLQLGKRILVRQSWNAAPVPPGGFELVIDPKRAFGSGYHATTQLIAEWLEDNIRGGERLLDVGTGSGILAMVALRLGAASALGIDNDPEAIECAMEYAAVNGFGAELVLRCASLEKLRPRRFDLVVANLDFRTIRRHLADFHLYLQPGGRLMVSGLLQEDVDEIGAASTSADWKIESRRAREEWVALELRGA